MDDVLKDKKISIKHLPVFSFSQKQFCILNNFLKPYFSLFVLIDDIFGLSWS